MSVENMLYVKETPWHGLGTQYERQPESTTDLVNKAKLNWTVSDLPMKSDLHEYVPHYHVVLRDDSKEILGVVNNRHPNLVQNADMFNAFDYLLGNSVDVETASSFDGGVNVFGCFKIREQYKILDDDIDHYFVVVNNHLKVDGKISVLNTPIRVICKNTLESAMSKNIYHLRMPVSEDASINRSVSQAILSSVGDAIVNLKKTSEDMVMKKTSPMYIEKVMDELFPFPKVDDETVLHTKAIESVEILRDTFKSECMDADNLDNYRGSQWQILNALVDFDTHYYKKADNAYDPGYRMKKLSGVGMPAEPSRVVKFLKIADKISV